MGKTMRFFILIFLSMFSISAAAEVVKTSAAAENRSTIVGEITVVDGDTLEMNNQHIKIWGVDAPNLNQTCKDGQNAVFDCGKESASALARWLVPLQPVQCETKGNDNAGNVIAICYSATGDDVGGWLVRNGYAIDWPKYSNGFYAVPQNEAQQAKNGVWQHNGVEPWKISEN